MFIKKKKKLATIQGIISTIFMNFERDQHQKVQGRLKYVRPNFFEWTTLILFQYQWIDTYCLNDTPNGQEIRMSSVAAPPDEDTKWAWVIEFVECTKCVQIKVWFFELIVRFLKILGSRSCEVWNTWDILMISTRIIFAITLDTGDFTNLTISPYWIIRKYRISRPSIPPSESHLGISLVWTLCTRNRWRLC